MQEVIPPLANITAQRVTPSVLGAGLVEAIDDADLLANELNPPSANVSFMLMLTLECRNSRQPFVIAIR